MNPKTLSTLTLLALLPAIAACTTAQTTATPAIGANAVKAANASISPSTQTASSKSLPYPEAAPNQTRWIISPAAIAAAAKSGNPAANSSISADNAQPETIRVEIIAGKTMQVDCNTHFLTGTFKEEVLQGWGYTYYQFHTTGNAASTRMACPPNDKPRTAFVAAPSITVPYNAKLPLVIYTPQGYHVQYRLWQAAPALLPAANE